MNSDINVIIDVPTVPYNPDNQQPYVVNSSVQTERYTFDPPNTKSEFNYPTSTIENDLVELTHKIIGYYRKVDKRFTNIARVLTVSNRIKDLAAYYCKVHNKSTNNLFIDSCYVAGLIYSANFDLSIALFKALTDDLEDLRDCDNGVVTAQKIIIDKAIDAIGCFHNMHMQDNPITCLLAIADAEYNANVIVRHYNDWKEKYVKMHQQYHTIEKQLRQYINDVDFDPVVNKFIVE